MEQLHTAKSKAYYYLGSFFVSVAIFILISFLTFETLYGLMPGFYVAAIALLGAVILISFFIFSYRRLKKGLHAQLEDRILSILRFVLSTVMLGYSYTKLHHGHMYLSYFALDNRLNDHSDFDIVWSFYGRYSAFQTLIGLLELVPAVLLLLRRTAFLGAVLMLPVIANVMILNIFYKIGGLTLPLSFLLTLFDLYLLYSHKDAILEFFRKVNDRNSKLPSEPSPTRKALSALRFLPLIFVTSVVLLKLISKGHPQPIRGAYELVEFKENGQLIPPDSLPLDAYKKIYFEKRHIQNSLVTKTGFQGAQIAFPAKDSITVAYRNGPLDVYVRPDTLTMFKGHFELSHDTVLLLKGTQNKQYISAMYKKIPLKEYAYWWE